MQILSPVLGSFIKYHTHKPNSVVQIEIYLNEHFCSLTFIAIKKFDYLTYEFTNCGETTKKLINVPSVNPSSKLEITRSILFKGFL